MKLFLTLAVQMLVLVAALAQTEDVSGSTEMVDVEEEVTTMNVVPDASRNLMDDADADADKKKKKKKKKKLGQKCKKDKNCDKKLYCNSGRCAKVGYCRTDLDCYNPSNQLKKKVQDGEGYLKCEPNKKGLLVSKNGKKALGRCVRDESTGNACPPEQQPPEGCLGPACSADDCDEAVSCADTMCGGCGNSTIFFNAVGERVCLPKFMPVGSGCSHNDDCGPNKYCGSGKCFDYGMCENDHDCENPANMFSIETFCFGKGMCGDDGKCTKDCECPPMEDSMMACNSPCAMECEGSVACKPSECSPCMGTHYDAMGNALQCMKEMEAVGDSPDM